MIRPRVADEAMESVQASSKDDFICRRWSRCSGTAARARAAYAYGEPVIDSLAFFPRDPEEDIFPPPSRAVGADPVAEDRRRLVAALEERRFIRYSRCRRALRREHPSSPSRANRSRRSRFRKRAVTSICYRSTTTSFGRRSSPPTRCSRRGSPSR